MNNLPKRGQRTATNSAKKKAAPKITVLKKPAAKKPTAKKPTVKKSAPRKVGNANERAALDQQTRSKNKPSTGFDPKTLSAKDRGLYNEYVKSYGKPSATWANGKPRNPMTEIRNQIKK